MIIILEKIKKSEVGRDFGGRDEGRDYREGEGRGKRNREGSWREEMERGGWRELVRKDTGRVCGERIYFKHFSGILSPFSFCTWKLRFLRKNNPLPLILCSTKL